MMFGKKDSKKFVKIFFATDIHGSDICFRKFLNAAAYYKVDALVLGGDLTGKMIVPIVEKSDGKFETNFLGNAITVDNSDGAKKLEEKIRNTGFYPYMTNSSEMKELQSDKSKVDDLFQKVMLETLERWLGFAEEILKHQGKKIYITGGNDDPFSIEPVLNKSNYVVNPEGKIVDIDEFQMISSGYSNMTPWKCPRDVEDTVLSEKIESMVSKLDNFENVIFNFHAPPINSELDTCPMLDARTYPPKPLIDSGGVRMYGAGSKAVRDAIEKHQPLLGLHGHIHESRGVIKIGKTTCVNPGSEYGEGILRGTIIVLAKGKVLNYQMTSG